MCPNPIPIKKEAMLTTLFSLPAHLLLEDVLINASSFPEIVRPGKRSKLDPYKAFLQERWAAGQRNIKQLVTELRNLGYRQGETIVYDYLRRMREQPAWLPADAVAKKQDPTASPLLLWAHEAAWLFARNPQRLRLTQVIKLDDLRRADEDLEAAYQLAQDFRVMVTKRQEAILARWLNEAKGSGIQAACHQVKRPGS